MIPTLDGQAVLGVAAYSVHAPSPSMAQEDAYFGVSGLTSLYGGGRGRNFEVNAVFIGESIADVIAAEVLLLSFDDGGVHVYTDTQGRTWPYCQFRSEYQPDPTGPHITDTGWCLPFRCIIRSLT